MHSFEVIDFHFMFASERYNMPENVAIANALQLEAARRRAVPICFNSSPVPSLKSLSLSVAVLERFLQKITSYRSYVILCCDLQLWPRDLDL